MKELIDIVKSDYIGFNNRYDKSIELNYPMPIVITLSLTPFDRDTETYYIHAHNKIEDISRALTNTKQHLLGANGANEIIKGIEELTNSYISFSDKDKILLKKHIEELLSHNESKYGAKVKDYYDYQGNSLGNSRLTISSKSILKNNLVFSFVDSTNGKGISDKQLELVNAMLVNATLNNKKVLFGIDLAENGFDTYFYNGIAQLYISLEDFSKLVTTDGNLDYSRMLETFYNTAKSEDMVLMGLSKYHFVVSDNLKNIFDNLVFE